MAKEMPASAKEIAGVAEAAGQVGIKKENILDFTKTMVMLGATTNLSAEQAATAMAQLANVMQLPQDEIDNLASVLVDLGNNGASTEAQILDMALNIAGAAKTVGISAQDVLGFANAIASVGIEAEAGGSAISRVFITIAQAVGSLKPSAEQLEAIATAQNDVSNASAALEVAQRGVRNAFESVSDAQRGVRNSTEGVGDAQRGLRNAYEAVSDASRGLRNAHEGVQQAQRGVRDATEGVAQAQRNSRNAAEALGDAQKNLTRAYRDQRQASLDARRETLSVAEAYQGLREVQAQAGSHALELREAQLAVAQAHKAVRDAAKGSGLEQAQASLSLSRAQQRLSQVQSQGGREALDLRNAQLRLEEANLRVGRSYETQIDKQISAQRGLRNAQEGVIDAARAERNAREAQSAAIRGLRDSVEGLAAAQRAQRNAAEGVDSAQRALRNAVEGVTGSQRGLRNAHEGVTDAQRAEKRAADELAEAQKRLADAMGTGKLEKFAEVAGMTSEAFAEFFKRDPSLATAKFVEGLERIKNEGGDVFKVLDDLGLADIRVTRTLLGLSGAGDLLFQSLQRGRAEFTKNAALQEEYAKRLDTTAAQLQLFMNRINDVAITLGDALVPIMNDLLELARPLFDVIKTGVDIFAALPKPLQVAIVSFVGLAAIIGPLLIAFAGVAAGLAALAPLMPLVAAGFTFMLGPVGLLIIAIAAVALGVYLLIKNFDKIKAAAGKAGDTLSGLGKEALSAFEPILDFFKNNWEEIATLISGPFAPIVALATDAFGIRSALEDALGGLIDTAGGLVEDIADAIGEGFTFITDAIKRNFNAETIGEAFGFFAFLPVRIIREALEEAIPAVIEFFGSTLPNKITDAVPDIIHAFDVVGDAITEFVLSLPSRVFHALDDLGDTINGFFINTLPNFIAGAAPVAFRAAVKFGRSFIEGAIEGIKTALSLLVSAPGWIIGAISDAFGAVTGEIERIGTKIMDGIFTGLGNAIGFLWDQFLSFASGFLNQAAKAFGFNKQQLVRIGKDIISGVLEGIQDRWDDVVEYLSKAFQKLPKPLRKILESFSPSRVFMRIGEDIVDGLALGLEGANKLTVAAPQMAPVMDFTDHMAAAFATNAPRVFPDLDGESWSLPKTGFAGRTGGGEATGALAPAAVKGDVIVNMYGPVNGLKPAPLARNLGFGVASDLRRRGIYV